MMTPPSRLTARIRTVLATAIVIAAFAATPAFAVSKEMIQLQTQIQQLQDVVARLQQSNDERMGVLKDLVQQTADSVNKMSVSVNGMQLRMQNQQDAMGAKSDQLSGQIQSLNDSLDEVKARMARMEKALNDIQGQQQSNAAALANLPQAGASPGSSFAQPAAPTYAPAPAGKPSPAVPESMSAPGSQGGPSVTELYRGAYGDYMAGKYPLALSEFQGVIAAYPDAPLSGNAYFYIGEIDMRTQKPTAAIKNYDTVLERYPDNQKTPAAHLHKGEALLAMRQNDAGIRELRALIQRYPNSPEASQARQKIASVHIR